MRKLNKVIGGVVLATTLFLGGCAGNTPWLNPQQYSGINRGTINFDSNTGKIVSIDVWGGKENASVALTGDIEKGNFTYSATDTKAFDGQKVRAAVEQTVSDDVKAVAPGIVDAVVKAVLGAINPASIVGTATSIIPKP